MARKKVNDDTKVLCPKCKSDRVTWISDFHMWHCWKCFHYFSIK